MLIFFLVFVLVSFALCPLAWIIGILDKISTVKLSKSKTEKILNIGIFIPLGLPIMVLNSLMDIYYFWMNNFRTDLKKIIILQDESTVSHESIKDLLNTYDFYRMNKIKSAHTTQLIKKFRKKLAVNQNL
jgi:hypothetical protein